MSYVRLEGVTKSYRLGEHTVEVRAAGGLDAAEIAALCADGAAVQADADG